ncbi:NUDIX hydrolase [Microvirga terricola]|uniref:NUDIX hydrolase n=1 Tax=Microvirga terricola TaxID=2719797 RepID=A0ABX0VGX7_9HYPH|nr:NUDIX hydrolase [Microvirga terricola]NIX78075.1 NUDIX hydrolase [Microvirga terricola]
MSGQASSPIPAVIAVIVHEGMTLLVRRANPPDAGLWGFPGGKIEYGETVEAAALRELFEETSITGEARGVITTLDIIERSPTGEPSQHFILIAVRCASRGGVPKAADDALEARWFPIADLHTKTAEMSADVERIARLAEDLARLDP